MGAAETGGGIGARFTPPSWRKRRTGRVRAEGGATADFKGTNPVAYQESTRAPSFALQFAGFRALGFAGMLLRSFA